MEALFLPLALKLYILAFSRILLQLVTNRTLHDNNNQRMCTVCTVMLVFVTLTYLQGHLIVGKTSNRQLTFFFGLVFPLLQTNKKEEEKRTKAKLRLSHKLYVVKHLNVRTAYIDIPKSVKIIMWNKPGT